MNTNYKQLGGWMLIFFVVMVISVVLTPADINFYLIKFSDPALTQALSENPMFYVPIISGVLSNAINLIIYGFIIFVVLKRFANGIALISKLLLATFFVSLTHLIISSCIEFIYAQTFVIFDAEILNVVINAIIIYGWRRYFKESERASAYFGAEQL